MKVFNLATHLGLGVRSSFGPKSWTCRRCILQAEGGARRFGTKSKSRSIPKEKRKGRILFAAAGGTGVAALAVGFGDDVKHAYGSVERTGRVASTLAVCINEYVFPLI